jgi:uncharacterized protein YecE (DUF72 family)
MQFGRCSDLTRVDFSLPALRARSASLLVRAGEPALEPWLRLGAPAFRRRDWLGGLYPAGVDEAKWLGIYASKLDALELNSTFYGLPSESTLARWVAETPPEFRICPKLPRAISHELGSSELQARVAAFVTRIEALGERLGPALCQLPESAGPDALPQLRAALDCFPDDFSLALEVRHAGWFERGALREDLLDWLEARGIASVITDVSGRRDASHASLTSTTAFVRFVGEGGAVADGAVEGSEPGRLAGITAAHNRVRAMVQTNSPLPPLQWSPTIAAYAQQWADMLASAGCTSAMHRSGAELSQKGYGENLAVVGGFSFGGSGAGTSSAEQAVKGWADEVQCWTYGTIGGFGRAGTEQCDQTCYVNMHSDGCGHYTQIVWRSTRELGCGVASCNSGFGSTDVWICNYSPAATSWARRRIETW